jgi:DNA-binding NarL/FixJ family response regulator
MLKPIRILVADDHDVVRQGVRMILEPRAEWQVCGEAVNGRQAVQMAKELKPDAIIMDIAMPEMTGIEATREISKLNLGCKVLIFTMHDSTTLPEYVRAAGASGYVLKSRASRDLLTALEGLLKGGTFFDTVDKDDRGAGKKGKKSAANFAPPPIT